MRPCSWTAGSARIPVDLTNSVLATLTEQTTTKKYDDFGNRMKPFDILFYQAATALMKIWRKNKELNEKVAHMNNVQNQKLIAYREFEEDTNTKLGHFEKLNKVFFTQKAFKEMLTITKKNVELRKSQMLKTKDSCPETRLPSVFKFERRISTTSAMRHKIVANSKRDSFVSKLSFTVGRPVSANDKRNLPNLIESPVKSSDSRTATKSQILMSSKTSGCRTWSYKATVLTPLSSRNKQTQKTRRTNPSSLVCRQDRAE